MEQVFTDPAELALMKSVYDAIWSLIKTYIKNITTLYTLYIN